MTTKSHWPALREGMSLSLHRFPAIGTVISLDFEGLFPLSFFAILDIRMRKTTWRCDTS